MGPGYVGAHIPSDRNFHFFVVSTAFSLPTVRYRYSNIPSLP